MGVSHLVFHTKLSLALRRSPKLVRVPKHIVQRNLRNSRKLVIANFAINDSPTTGIQSTNDLTCTKKKCLSGPEQENRRGGGHVLWNSEGATTSTVITGSNIIAAACLNASLNAPIAASLNANSEESTAWKAPSFKTKRTPVIGLPERVPFSSAS
jgi:hypothetical protein